jgi:hypothetical protein
MSRSDNFNAVNSIGNGEVDSSILSGSTIFRNYIKYLCTVAENHLYNP